MIDFPHGLSHALFPLSLHQAAVISAKFALLLSWRSKRLTAKTGKEQSGKAAIHTLVSRGQSSVHNVKFNVGQIIINPAAACATLI
jgi:hypothetical protein